MAYQQNTQSFCPNCGKQTLHIRTVQTVNHVLHFLVTFLLCGLWLPIWILATLFKPSPEPYRCTQCGGDAKDARREQRETARLERVAQEATPETVAARMAKAQRRREFREAIVREFKGTPQRVDQGLRFISGEGNDIIYRTLQVVTLAACLALPALAIFLAWRWFG